MVKASPGPNTAPLTIRRVYGAPHLHLYEYDDDRVVCLAATLRVRPYHLSSVHRRIDTVVVVLQRCNNKILYCYPVTKQKLNNDYNIILFHLYSHQSYRYTPLLLLF